MGKFLNFTKPQFSHKITSKVKGGNKSKMPLTLKMVTARRMLSKF